MASLGATVWPKPIALVPCLSWTSASVTFTRGQLKKDTNLLQNHSFGYRWLLHFLTIQNFALVLFPFTFKSFNGI